MELKTPSDFVIPCSLFFIRFAPCSLFDIHFSFFISRLLSGAEGYSVMTLKADHQYLSLLPELVEGHSLMTLYKGR